MRKDVTAAAGERIAEGGAATSVHNIGGHHREMQVRRHFEKHLELINLRTVLGRSDVEFDKAVDRLLTGLLADAEMSRLATGWTDAAGLKTHAIEPAVFRARLSKPVGRQALAGLGRGTGDNAAGA